jgi:hypothetical protein
MRRIARRLQVDHTLLTRLNGNPVHRRRLLRLNWLVSHLGKLTSHRRQRGLELCLFLLKLLNILHRRPRLLALRCAFLAATRFMLRVMCGGEWCVPKVEYVDSSCRTRVRMHSAARKPPRCHRKHHLMSSSVTGFGGTVVFIGLIPGRALLNGVDETKQGVELS